MFKNVIIVDTNIKFFQKLYNLFTKKIYVSNLVF
jgi:hypothetical protein